MISIGATDDQADEFVEALDDLATKTDLDHLENRIIRQILVIGILLTGLNIAAMALLTQL
jgi:hypothetical protein